MLVRHRLIPLVCVLALLPASPALAGPHAPVAIAAKKHKKKRKRCRRGYKLKLVKKHGKRVRRCVKVRHRHPRPTPIFKPPGQKLSGNDAVPFLRRYLFDSTFTDCPAGWPNCSVEERYSHTSGGAFYYCRLTPDPGSDIINGGRAYQVRNAVVQANGSWAFNEVVDNYGNPSYYEWHIATDGTVTGTYQYNDIEQIGPLRYVSGARDCSY